MRNVIATFGMAALAVAGTAAAGGQKCEREAKIARAIAVAEVDFELHRAQLGLVGSSLLSEGQKATPAGSAPAEKPEPYRIAAPPEPPATPVAASEPHR